MNLTHLCKKCKNFKKGNIGNCKNIWLCKFNKNNIIIKDNEITCINYNDKGDKNVF